MKRFHHVVSLLFLMLLYATSVHATVVKDTIYSAQGDRVIVTYDIIHNENKATISFLKAEKKLTGKFKEKYPQLSEVKVIFYDRVGNYGDNSKFKGKSIKAFTVPADAHYHRSREGYFIIDEEPSITFDVDNGQKPVLKLPIFLAHYEKKRQYEVFGECAPLAISLGKKKTPSTSGNKSNARTTSSYETQTVTETVTETVDGTEDAVTPADEAINRIATAKRLLAEQDRLPIDANLSDNIDKLRDLEYKVPNDIRSQISSVLSAYDQKKRELEDQAKADEESSQAAAQAQADKKAQEAIARQDSINNAEQERQKIENEKSKKRNIWMAIGAAVLGLLGFGGNQLLQNRRNAMNQQSMMNMQQSMVKRAENEAKRRAQSYARNKAHQAVNQVKSKGRKAVQSNVSKVGNAVKGNVSKTGNAVKGNVSKTGNATKGNAVKGNIAKSNKKDNGGISI